MTQLLTAKQMRDSDARAIGGCEDTSRKLMYYASYGVYNNVKWYGKIGIVVGKGNNGADGKVASSILSKKHGFNVAVLNVDNGIFKLFDNILNKRTLAIRCWCNIYNVIYFIRKNILTGIILFKSLNVITIRSISLIDRLIYQIFIKS